MDSDRPRVGVAVPAYEPDLPRLRRYLDELSDAVADDIVVALDDPEPGVADALREHATVQVSAERRGKGAAITAAFDSLVSDVDRLAFADADASTPAASVADIVAALDSGAPGTRKEDTAGVDTPGEHGDMAGVDTPGEYEDTAKAAPSADGGTRGASVAVGTRRHPDSDVRSHQSVVRRSLGVGFVRLAQTLLDVRLTDYQCGAKAITADAWRAVRPNLHESGFAWDAEFVAVADALGERVVEVPIVWEDRPGKTVSPVGDTLSMARGLFAARERAAAVRGSPSPLARIVCPSEPLTNGDG